MANKKVENLLKYGGDFSLSFDDRSLIDKAYAISIGYPAPVISSGQNFKKNQSVTTDITLYGGFFTPLMTVDIQGQVVNSVTFVSDNEVIVNVTTGTTDDFYDITVTTTTGSDTANDIFEVKLSVWLDLRLGGDVFTDGNGAGNNIRYRDGMSLSRDVNGMSFSGSNPWSSWVKFESEGFTRASQKSVSWIFTGWSAAFMIGIGSDATNETSTSQYLQMEVEAYFSSSTNLWGLYGNNGTVGTTGSQSDSQAVNSSNVYKIVFESAGDLNDTFNLYQLPSANPADWDDTSNLIKTITIGGSLNPDEPNLFPVIIPRDETSSKFIALKVE